MEIIKELPDEVIFWCLTNGIDFIESDPIGYVVLDGAVAPSQFDKMSMVSVGGKVYARIRYSRAINRFVYNVVGDGETYKIDFVDDSVIDPERAMDLRQTCDHLFVEDINGNWYSIGYDNYLITYDDGFAIVIRSFFSMSLSTQAILQMIKTQYGGIKQFFRVDGIEDEI